MTTEKASPLSARVERALATETLAELAFELAGWPPDELESLSSDLKHYFLEARERLRREHLRERRLVCDDHRVLLDACFREVIRQGDLLYEAVAGVVALVQGEVHERAARDRERAQ